MSEKPLKIWLVKYWQTKGIIDGQISDDGRFVSILGRSFVLESFYREGKDWFRYEEDALKEAIALSSERYLSLYRQAEKVEALNRKFHDRLEEIENAARQ